MEKVLKCIKKNNILNACVYFFPVCLFTGLSFFMIYVYIQSTKSDSFGYLFIAALFGLFAFFYIKQFVRSIKLVINPTKDDVFKKYGSPEKIAKILKEIDNTKIYEDNYLIIAENYISDKTDYSKIVACEDVLGAYKLVHKINFKVDYYQMVIIDKYNQTTRYQYGSADENIVDQLLMLIDLKCHNAIIGYTNQTFENIKNNLVKLPKKGKSQKKTNQLKDKNHGKNKKTKKLSLDEKYSDLNKLKELLDNNIITKKEFEKEKKKILKK